MTSAVLIATDVQAENNQTDILICRNVYGIVTTTLDERIAELIGVVAGLVVGLLLLGGQLIFRRKNNQYAR
jgi:hypothetical protein